MTWLWFCSVKLHTSRWLYSLTYERDTISMIQQRKYNTIVNITFWHTMLILHTYVYLTWEGPLLILRSIGQRWRPNFENFNTLALSKPEFDIFSSYRTREEIQHQRENYDPIGTFKQKIVTANLVTAEELKVIIILLIVVINKQLWLV